MKLPIEKSGSTATTAEDEYTQGHTGEYPKYDKRRESRTFGFNSQGRGFLGKEPDSTSVIPLITIHNVILAEIENKSMSLPISISCGEKIVKTKALLNTGAGGKFIDQNFIWQNKLETWKLEKSIMVYNVDGTKNKKGTITRCVDVNLLKY